MLTFDSPKDQSSIIKVLGVGGGGGNAVNHMFKQGITGVDFILCNTDVQALENSEIPTKIQLGTNLTEGRGAGSKPEVGRNAAIEDVEKIKAALSTNTKMLFITAGMGGGTGTGAAPVIAEVAYNMDILTVGIVTIPFAFEGRRRRQLAEAGIAEMKKYVDTILVISNDKLRQLHGDLTLSDAFGQADNILATAAKGIAEIITVTGYINVDFEDVKTVMKGSGVAIMGAGIAQGEDRAKIATEMALNSPLLNDSNINGASDMLLYIATGAEREISMDEVSEITEYIIEHTGDQCDVIWGSGTDKSLGSAISITLIATGFDRPAKVEEPVKSNFRITVLGEDEKKEKEQVFEAVKPEVIEPSGMVLITKPVEETKPVTTLFGEHEIRPSIIEKESAIAELTSQTVIIKKTEEKVQPELNIFDSSEVKKAEPAQSPSQSDKQLSERARKLREMSYVNKPGSIDEMENVPAYKRKNIMISHTVTSRESEVARYSLTERDGNVEMRTNNSFLHDNVD